MYRMFFRFSSLFSALFLLMLAAVYSPTASAYQLDKANHTIVVSPGSDPNLNTKDLRNVMSYLVNRTDKTTWWTVKFKPGKYSLAGMVLATNLQYVSFWSDPAAPAKLVKAPGWSDANGEYLLNFQMSKNLSIAGLEFYGLTSFANSKAPVWPDQGLYLGSCDTVKVDRNKFYNFGNAPLRVTTTERDPVKGVHSFNTTVTNNTFNNFYQLSTTANDGVHGGTAHYRLQNNNFVNLRGSVKFASRTPGAEDIHLLNNTINGGDHFGFEICNYSNVEIRGNLIQNLASVGINIYTGTGDRIPKGFTWGDNVTIAGNTLKNVGYGIRYSHEKFEDGFQNVPKNLVLDGNTIDKIALSSNWPAITIVNDQFNGVKVTYNKFYGIPNKRYIGVASGSTGVSILGNLVEGLAFGLQPSTASK